MIQWSNLSEVFPKCFFSAADVWVFSPFCPVGFDIIMQSKAFKTHDSWRYSSFLWGAGRGDVSHRPLSFYKSHFGCRTCKEWTSSQTSSQWHQRSRFVPRATRGLVRLPVRVQLNRTWIFLKKVVEFHGLLRGFYQYTQYTTCHLPGDFFRRPEEAERLFRQLEAPPDTKLIRGLGLISPLRTERNTAYENPMKKKW